MKEAPPRPETEDVWRGRETLIGEYTTTFPYVNPSERSKFPKEATVRSGKLIGLVESVTAVPGAHSLKLAEVNIGERELSIAFAGLDIVWPGCLVAVARVGAAFEDETKLRRRNYLGNTVHSYGEILSPAEAGWNQLVFDRAALLCAGTPGESLDANIVRSGGDAHSPHWTGNWPLPRREDSEITRVTLPVGPAANMPANTDEVRYFHHLAKRLPTFDEQMGRTTSDWGNQLLLEFIRLVDGDGQLDPRHAQIAHQFVDTQLDNPSDNDSIVHSSMPPTIDALLTTSFAMHVESFWIAAGFKIT